MNAQTTKTTLSNRQFVALVRASLDAAGHRDIPVNRSWIDEDTPGHPFLLNVPVGLNLVVPLRPRNDFHYQQAEERCDFHIDEFTGALINLRRAETMLVKYVRDVRRTATAAIATAQAEGLDLALDGVYLKPTYAAHLTGSSWKDAACHVLALVKVRNTSFFLQPEISEVLVEEPGDIDEELERLKDEQRERQERLAELDALGADLEVDTITLGLLEAHGLVAADVLRQVWKKQHVSLTVQHLGKEASLSLISSDGKVRSALKLEDAFWNGEYLWFLTDEGATGHEGLVGQSLGDRIAHPVLSRRPIVKVDVSHPAGRDMIYLDTSERLLFDADTGRIWRQERLAA